MNEHNPDNLTPEQYGAPEWRLLLVGEKINAADERRITGPWYPTCRIGETVQREQKTTYRRRVSPPSPETDAAERAESANAATVGRESTEEDAWIRKSRTTGNTAIG